MNLLLAAILPKIKNLTKIPLACPLCTLEQTTISDIIATANGIFVTMKAWQNVIVNAAHHINGHRHTAHQIQPGRFGKKHSLALSLHHKVNFVVYSMKSATGQMIATNGTAFLWKINTLSTTVKAAYGAPSDLIHFNQHGTAPTDTITMTKTPLLHSLSSYTAPPFCKI
jgi:hypothetical protein